MTSMLRLASLVLSAFVVVAAADPAPASPLKSVKVVESAKLPAIRPNWPIPSEPNQIFYLQRSSNSNTVVYVASYDDAGNLRRKKPARVYWRRYNTTGERKALKAIEQRFAYGISTRPGPVEGEHTVWLKPLPELKMTLRRNDKGRGELIANLGGREVRAVYGFLTVDESGVLPKVTQLSLHGIDLATGRAVTEIFAVSGGTIKQ